MLTTLTKSQSNAIKIVVFFATLLVVFRHGVNLHHYYIGGSPWMAATDANIWCQRFISEFTSLAIPCFFGISGFLFFLGLKDFSDIKTKLGRRVKSLLIPYLLWNILGLIWWLSLSLVPQLHDQLVQSYGISWTWQWFIKKLTIEPMVGQFWYIRTLMIFVLFTPVLWVIFRYKIISLLILTTLMSYWLPVDCRIFSTEGMFWFYFGGLISYNNWQENLTYQKISWLLWPTIVGLIIGQINSPVWWICWKLRICLSVMGLLQLALFLTKFDSITQKLGCLNHYSFFIYAIHGSVLAAISMLLSRVIAHTPVLSFSCYWLCTISTIFIAILAALVMKKITPQFYNLLTGSRG